uniref:Cyclic nucleotide-binding domain-containing protein n=1 Tax=Kalanchoe fedtschenkoi TaxID=63787 RepID=A0A7N0VED8_KALFE
MEVVRIETALRALIIVQYLLRLYLTFPLSSQIIKSTGVVMKRAWAGAAYNLMLYVLASHVIGSCWYLLAVDRQEVCWRRACLLDPSNCNFAYFDCQSLRHTNGISWLRSSNISTLCNARNDYFEFGIYGDLITFKVGSSSFVDKYFYCLCCLGQNLITSTYVEENVFAIIIGTIGLVLFASLISNLQTYLQSTTVRVEEWRIKMTDTEQWMHHRQLPRDLRQRVRLYGQYRWVTTRGVDEEAILKALPVDLRRDIKRHLCLDLVRRVPLFDQMDDRMLDAICERLRPELCTPNTCVVREGDPVKAMLFIIRGRLDSWTTNGGQIGFFNCCWIGPTDFCGEELLTWALDPATGMALPSSTRTVKAVTDVEAFALSAEDLKFVASQFRRLHSKQVRHTFRFHSHQWRTWGACFIQAAWFRYKRKKEVAELKALESQSSSLPQPVTPTLHPTNLPILYGTRMGGSTRSVSRRSGIEYEIRGALLKPADPDFTVDHK